MGIDELLSAYAAGELGPVEHAAVLAALASAPHLHGRRPNLRVPAQWRLRSD